MKDQDIRSSFIFSSLEDFKVLNNTIALSLSLGENNEWSIIQSLDIIIEENFSQNDELGFKLLDNIFQNYPRALRDLYKTIKAIINKSEVWAIKLWELIKSWNNDFKIYWQLSFYDYLPEALVNDFFKNELINTINSINQPCTLFFESFEKFKALDKDILHKILSIAVDKNELLNLRITYSYHFFEKYTDYFSDNFELLSKAYVQQVKFDMHFDFDSKGLQNLILKNPAFLIKYLTIFYTEKHKINRNTEKYIPFIWDMENQEPLIEEAVNLIIENNPYFGIGDYSLNIMFNRLSDSQKQKAKKFIFYYISKYKDNVIKLNPLFDVIRHVLNDIFEEVFIFYLSINTDINIFKKIHWIGNGGVYKGEIILGEINAEKWQALYKILAKCENKLDIIPIRTYIKELIEREMKNADWERKQKFSNPDYL